ncbi:MAG: response regulator [Cyanobacteria bacterium P01_F01_bin.53]
MSKTVLVVDDEDDARAIALLGLRMKTDWTLLEANSGQQALDMAAAQAPDAILLDMMMPDMDGKATLKKLKENPQTQTIPVILMTAKVQPLAQTGIEPEDVVTVFAKPFRPLTLATELREALSW